MTLKEKMFEIALNNIDGMTEEEAEHYLENDAIPATGSVSGLIYYSETEPITIEYFDDIIEIMKEYHGDCIPSEYLSLNNMAWFAFEHYVFHYTTEIIEEAKKRGLLNES